MFDTLFIVSIIGSAVQAFKETNTPAIPAENWANEELYHKDIMNGVSVEQRMKNLENGKYRLTEKYPEPHRDPQTGQIIIENCKLYYDDIDKYGMAKAKKWAEQGKYNLSGEALKKENERIKKRYNLL